MATLSPSLHLAIETVGRLLRSQGATWLLGGSCGLLQHQVVLNGGPRDLDIYFDQEDIDTVFIALESYAVKRPHFSQTDKYESTLSHYLIEGIEVEGVGSFRVHSLDSCYKVEAAYLFKQYPLTTIIGSESINLMPLGHELLFNILRDRADRYTVIAEAIVANKDLHLPACMDLLKRNQWGEEVLKQVEQLLSIKL